MAKFILLNKEEEYVQTLKNVTSAKGNKVINGEDVSELTIFDTEVEKNYRILIQDDYRKWHEYIVKEIEETHNAKGTRKTLFCESSLYETIGDFIEDRRFNKTNAQFALSAVTQFTRFKVGRVDDLGINSYSPYRVDAKTAIQEIAKIWRGEIQTRIEVSGNKITGRYIDLLKRVGNDTGKRFSWSKDIKQIKRTVIRDDVITALYGFGKGEEVGEGYSRRIDFAELNDGKMYVEDLVALEQFGRIMPDGTKKHAFGRVDFDDETDKAMVKERTIKELEELSKPQLSYSAEVIDLKKFKGCEHEGFELGDTVLIIDKAFKPQLRVLARIIEKETDFLDELNSDVTIGNFIPTITTEDLKNEGYINNFRDKSGVWDRSNYISADGRIFIDDLLDQLNAKANATGGYFYYTEGQGTITTDRPIDENPTKAVEIKGGTIRIANEKLPNGEWNWRTALDGNGIIADEVNTGKLNAALVQAGFNDIAYGIIFTQDGLYAVAPAGNYSALQDGAVKFYDSLDNLNGRISSSYAGEERGVGIFIKEGKKFVLVREYDNKDNETIIEVPNDKNEVHLKKHVDALGRDINNIGYAEAHTFKVTGTNQKIGNFQGGGGAYYDTLKVSLGIGDENGVDMKVTALKDRVQLGDNLDANKNELFNIWNVRTYNNGYEGWNFMTAAGVNVLAGRKGIQLGVHDTRKVDVILDLKETGAMVAHRDLNMNGNSVTGTSDMRLKDKIEDVDFDALDKVDKMVFKFFEWDKTLKFNEEKPEGKRFGQLAQYAPKEMQVQNGDRNHFLSLDMQVQNDLNSMAIQELNKKTKKIEKLEQKVADLEALMKDKGVI